MPLLGQFLPALLKFLRRAALFNRQSGILRHRPGSKPSNFIGREPPTRHRFPLLNGVE
jgi:hypothetical protein